jgi:hypothetical protein
MQRPSWRLLMPQFPGGRNIRIRRNEIKSFMIHEGADPTRSTPEVLADISQPSWNAGLRWSTAPG